MSPIWYVPQLCHSCCIITHDWQADLSRVIEDFLNVTAECAPSILILKPKFHFLVHLPAFIRRFGPAILFSTERYESFNRVFRLASIYSNRLSPSRDTCNTFASQDIMKHIATGGFWFDTVLKNWVRAGRTVLAYIWEKPERARQLGIPSEKKHMAGEAFLPRKSSNDGKETSDLRTVKWNETRSAKLSDPAIPVPENEFYCANSVRALHGDVATLGKHVIFAQSGKVITLLSQLMQRIHPRSVTVRCCIID